MSEPTEAEENARKLEDIERRANLCMRALIEIPMNADRKVKALRAAVSDILKIINPPEDRPNGVSSS